MQARNQREARVKGDEKYVLRDRFDEMVSTFRRTIERERMLKEALKKQHASLHQAYHRCREVQIEPQPSHPPLPIAIVPWPHPSYRPL